MRITLVISSAKTLEFTVPDLPSGVTVSSATFMIKETLATLDADALVEKNVGAVATNDGQVVNSGSNGTARLRFEILHSDLADLSWKVVYVYAIKCILSNGRAYSPLDGVGTVHLRNAGVDAIA
jgi:hypothetical protein